MFLASKCTGVDLERVLASFTVFTGAMHLFEHKLKGKIDEVYGLPPPTCSLK